MVFNTESDFENAVIQLLRDKGWNEPVLKNVDEKYLLQNWANILYQNNSEIDRLNNVPLTDGEMQQIIEQITNLRTPLKLNGFINGKTVSIIRDNPDDALHFGKEISLKIYDRREIAAGQSCYQIVQQPTFLTSSEMLSDRRGDVMLLINGMPVIHIELKKSGVPVSQAVHQIEKYTHEGAFSGLFSLIQIFVAMEPNEAVYFANPGVDARFNPDYYFHWADFNNKPINNWKDITSLLLSIPMAHQLIGFYTVADNKDGVLKVMRSYQYFAASSISDKVARIKWDGKNQLGGYIWHTTGSGKTMTSFKSAQLIANSKDADKVIFLMDRIELGTQSAEEYRGFADENESVQETEDTRGLITKLKSSNPHEVLIVTSIQKMSNIKGDDEGFNAKDIEVISSKRIVFIIDEAHRSTFGDMLINIKHTFPNAVFFGFTGTPIFDENLKKMNNTSDIFGDELHRYSIADGIRDKNVLGFDLYRVATFKDRDVRKVVALHNAKAKNETEATDDENKKAVFDKFMNSKQIKMAGYFEGDGKYIKGIEDYLFNIQYATKEHQKAVVSDICDNWSILSRSNKFHAIFATSSIPEAIEYYRLIRNKMPNLKVTVLFDPNIGNNGDSIDKEHGLAEIIEDYNQRYGQKFTISTHAKFKKDIALRLAHKEQYKMIERTPEQQLDLLIVVDQMLTGFDSKWINTLYLDKLLKYENIIQAFSRTNRLFGPEKPFGTIKYYRKVHTMEKNINNAIKSYSGDKVTGLFVQQLEKNLNKMNAIFDEIGNLFERSKVANFEKLPEDISERGKFAVLFKELNDYLEAAKIQGFKWTQLCYEFSHGKGRPKTNVTINFNETIYLVLVLRYKELFKLGGSGGGGGGGVPFDLVSHLTEIDTGIIDADYMNSRFDKYLKSIQIVGSTKDEVEQALNELHKTFASLTQEEQKYADIFIRDIQRGNVLIEEGKTLRDYITGYQVKYENDKINQVGDLLGLDVVKLRDLMKLNLTEANINEYNRFDELKDSVDKFKAKVYFDKIEGTSLPMSKVHVEIKKLLSKLLLDEKFEFETMY